MKQYRKSSHSQFDIKMHVAFITKYRKKILKGDVAKRIREIIKIECEKKKVEIIKGAISKDHVHMLISMPPNMSVSKLMQSVKGRSSHKIQMEYESVRKEYWGKQFWARGYFCVSVGNVSEEMIKDYIEHHFEDPDAEESFRIE